MKVRAIEMVFPEERVIDDGDMLLRRSLPVYERESLGPFVFLDHYKHHSRRGIGDKPHPHAGIEVISYLLDGAVEHRDSVGFRDRLEAGDAQWIRAGRGMLHAEQPQGGRHGLQLWTSLPPAMKHADPDYASLRAADIPEIKASGAVVRVVAGTVNGLKGPMRNATPTVFAVVHLDASASISLDVPAEELGAYVVEGAIVASGEELVPGNLAVFGDGEFVQLTAGPGQPAVVALVGGEKVQGKLIFDGPFVMDTPERIAEAKRDFLTGKMGTLDGVPF